MPGGASDTGTPVLPGAPANAGGLFGAMTTAAAALRGS